MAFRAHKKAKNDYDVNDGSKEQHMRGKTNKAYISAEEGKGKI